MAFTCKHHRLRFACVASGIAFPQGLISWQRHRCGDPPPPFSVIHVCMYVTTFSLVCSCSPFYQMLHMSRNSCSQLLVLRFDRWKHAFFLCLALPAGVKRTPTMQQGVRLVVQEPYSWGTNHLSWHKGLCCLLDLLWSSKWHCTLMISQFTWLFLKLSWGCQQKLAAWMTTDTNYSRSDYSASPYYVKTFAFICGSPFSFFSCLMSGKAISMFVDTITMNIKMSS